MSMRSSIQSYDPSNHASSGEYWQLKLAETLLNKENPTGEGGFAVKAE